MQRRKTQEFEVDVGSSSIPTALRLGAETGVAMADGTLQVFEDELLRQGVDIGSARANKVEAGAQCSLS